MPTAKRIPDWTTVAAISCLCVAGACGTFDTGGGADGDSVEDPDGGVSDVKLSAPTTYQAEAYTAESGCARATNREGYTGSGFVDFGENGSYIEWNNVNAPAAGGYRLTFRYANGGVADRQAAIVIQGASVGSVAFAPTGGWTSWTNAMLDVALRAGDNTIRVLANADRGGPNLDRMEVALIDACPNDSKRARPR